MATKRKWRAHPLLIPIKNKIRKPPHVPAQGSDPSAMGFTTKVRYKVAYDHRPILTLWADKVGVRKYVAEKVGEKYLNEVYIETNDVADLDFSKVPREFAFKPSHGSGAGIFVHEGADRSALLPKNIEDLVWRDKFHIHPDNLDLDALKKIGEKWLSMRYENNNPWYEWAYQDVEARLLVEKYLKNSDGSTPTNYLVYTFAGVPKYVINYNVFTGFIAIVTPEWEHIEIDTKAWTLATREEVPPKPARFEEMLEVASKLSGGIDFVRVDLYEVNGKVIFGEMTNYPGGGRTPIYSKDFDALTSSFWKSFDGY
jgi:hypothetical protein